MKDDKEVQETYDRISGIVKGKLEESECSNFEGAEKLKDIQAKLDDCVLSLRELRHHCNRGGREIIDAALSRLTWESGMNDEGEEITCLNCETRPIDVGIEIPNSIGLIWYCSYECYDEKTKDEG